jgi:hypothetical protein
MIRKILIITLLIEACFSLRSQILTKEYLRSVQEADQFYYFEEDYNRAARNQLIYKSFNDPGYILEPLEQKVVTGISVVNLMDFQKPEKLSKLLSLQDLKMHLSGSMVLLLTRQ